MKEKETLLKVRNLNKVFKNKNVVVKAIDNASFEVKKGEVVGLIGESGSGKTTIGRTVIGLHNATSGIMELEGKDITNYEKKRVRKNVVRNVQMIFQDPYSSLNGQKNVLSIVSEPLVASKLWKEDLNKALVNRRQILKYYKYSLIEIFNKKYNDYRIFANKKAYDFTKKLNKKLLAFTVNEKQTKKMNVNTILGLFYRERHETNLNILDKLVDTEEELFAKWAKFDDNIKTLKNIPADEKALIKIEADIEKLRALIKNSSKAIDLKNQIINVKNQIKSVDNSFKEKKQQAWNTFKKCKSLFKDDYKVEKVEKLLSKKNVDYKFHEKKMIVAKQKIAFIEKLWDSIKVKTWFDMETVSGFFANEFTKESAKKDFTSLVISENDKINVELLSLRSNLSEELNSLLSELKIELGNDRTKEVLKYKKALADKEAEKTNAIKTFEEETKIFLEKFNVEFKKKAEEQATKINQYLDAYKELKVQNKKIFDNIISNIENKFPNDKLKASKVKSWIKKEEEKNSALEIELKNVQKNIKIVKKLFNIDKTTKTVLSIYLKKLIIRNKVYDALKHSGLKTSYAYRYPHEFSGGMRQRVGIARAIIGEPKLIIADEPIAALDLSIQAQVVNMLLDQKDRLGLAMIFIAHDLSMVRFNSDRVLIMHLGKIVEYGDTDMIFDNPIHPYTKNLMKSMPSIKKTTGKIEVSEFKPKYLESYSATNQPTYHEYKKGHFVLGTNAQFNKWK